MSSAHKAPSVVPQASISETASETRSKLQPNTATQSVEVLSSKQPTVVTNYAATVKSPSVVTPETASTETAAASQNPGTNATSVNAVSASGNEPAAQGKLSGTTQSVAATGEKKAPGPLARLFSFGKPRPRGETEVLSAEAEKVDAPATVSDKRPRRTAQRSSGGEKLPGVRLDNLFGVGKKDRISGEQPVRLASAAGLARLAPNGLRHQHDAVNTACLKPKLVNLLAQVRRHYGRDVVITSGFRSAKQQRRIGGVQASRHTTCEAADIQVPGVGKWELAKYLRRVRGRGGVGTYCHTRSVHIDVGRKRDWNWRCKRR